MFLAYRHLVQDKLRSALSVVGVGLALMLVLILNGFLTGIYRSAASYLDHAPGSLVVARQDVKNFMVTGSSLSPKTLDAVRRVPGVAKVVPVLAQSVFFSLHGQKQFVYLVGYDPALGGGPWSLVAGYAPRTDDEVVLDQVLARQQSIGIGDRLNILNRTFTVSGFSAGTSTWMLSYAFVQKTSAESLLLAQGAANYLFVTPASGVSAQALRERLQAIPGTEVALKSDMAANDVTLLTRVYSLPMQLMVAIAFLVGTLVVGLIIYTATVERRREYGVLKAIGTHNWRLYRVIATQAGLVSITGALAGMGLAFGAAQLIMYLRPQFLIVIEPLALALVLVAGLVMALLAAFFPARLIAGLAPAEVFRR